MTYYTLEAAPDVIERMKMLFSEAAPKLPWEENLALLTGIPFIEREEYATGAYKLTEHSACTPHADKGEVTHENCPVLSWGRFSSES